MKVMFASLVTVATLIGLNRLTAQEIAETTTLVLQAQVKNVRLSAELTREGRGPESTVQRTMSGKSFEPAIVVTDFSKLSHDRSSPMKAAIQYTAVNKLGLKDRVLDYWHPDSKSETGKLLEKHWNAMQSRFSSLQALKIHGVLNLAEVSAVLVSYDDRPIHALRFRRIDDEWLLSTKIDSADDLTVAIAEAAFREGRVEAIH